MTRATRVFAPFTVIRRRLLSLVLIASVPAAQGQPTNLQLPATAHGPAAVSLLGAHLPEVAKAYGFEAQALSTLFQTQPSLGVDRGGALLFACDGLAVTNHGRLVNDGDAGRAAEGSVAEAMTANSSVTAIANGGTVDALKLHSLPGVTRVIYLDFDGHTTSGTSWNSSYTGGAPIVSAPFDLDGSPATFSASELSMIQKIWQRVAEDYAPFGVDVTTEDPGLEGLRKTTSSDGAFGIRVVISPTNWYNSGAGGVAYIGSFSWNTDTPCFAFSQQLANGEKYIAECVSHEVGHTVGLNHDGTSGTGATQYYQGQGNWAPIMGVGYYKPVVQFSKGEYANANNTQDDLAIIATHIPITGDDHGNTLATATIVSGPTVNTGGTIESRTDVDLFRFDAASGTLALEINGPAPDMNVDLKAELLNAGGGVVATSDSTSALNASFMTNVAAGTYFLRVSCVGNGDPATTGYSSYASIGNYLVTGSFSTAGMNQAPTAVATASAASGVAPLSVTFSGTGSSDSDGSIVTYSWDFGDGTPVSGATVNRTYTASGIFTAALTVVDNGGLAGTTSIPVTVTLPPNTPPAAVAEANPTTGLAPHAVTFNGSGSSDADGIQSYHWEFGDGTTSNQAVVQKTYAVPNTYVAKLTVTDARGATTTSTPVQIVVERNPANDVDVFGLTLTSVAAKGGTTGSAAIEVRNRSGGVVANATVTVQWSGVVSGTSSGRTDVQGRLILSAPKSKKAGVLTATLASVAPPAGYVYVPVLYAADSSSITLK